MATIVGYTQVQYSGIWSLSGQANAQASGTWTVQPNTLFSWGYNGYGQLGLGNTTSYSSPKQVTSTSNWIYVAGAYTTSFGIKKGGTLWGWGSGRFGMLGLGNETYYSSPKQIGALSNWSTIVTNAYQTYAIKTDGTLWAWGGNNPFGQLGLGNRTAYSSPKQVGALTTWLKISSGYGRAFAIRTDGTLWAWGYNSTDGMLGLNSTSYAYSSPTQVGSLTTWYKVSGAQDFAAAIKTDGTLWTWGRNAVGQLGLGTASPYTPVRSPVQVGLLTTWASVFAGGQACFAIKTDGTLWCWGKNNSGQLGLGNTTNYSSPKQVGSLTNWSLISMQNNTQMQTTGALKTDGTLWSWGYNTYGGLGLGNTTDYSSPKQIGSGTGWSQIAVGQGKFLAVYGV